jgi:tRNA-Thr(GGU) m(6)t(6)A37 methyltransferase TsaA
MNVEPIGIVRSPVREGVDKDWGRVIAEIHLSGHLAPGLAGLEQFSHIVVVFFIHQSSFDPKTDLVRRPQGRSDMPEVGIFAQRAKHRPNPIGVSAVKLISVRDNILTVRGLDAIDGTPVLDIKPYFPSFDRVEEPSVPEWVGRLMVDYF